MTHASLPQSEQLAEKLSGLVNGLIVPWKQATLAVSGSFGAATYNRLSQADTLLFLVDKDLYRHKAPRVVPLGRSGAASRSEEHTSELQSLMRISYAVFCLKKKKNK